MKRRMTSSADKNNLLIDNPTPSLVDVVFFLLHDASWQRVKKKKVEVSMSGGNQTVARVDCLVLSAEAASAGLFVWTVNVS